MLGLGERLITATADARTFHLPCFPMRHLAFPTVTRRESYRDGVVVVKVCAYLGALRPRGKGGASCEAPPFHRREEPRHGDLLLSRS
jgi:hypothetical protein